jgi:catechol 2,3-dioxygenase-like lactoylglutathione lyase family enzyme
MKQSIGYVSLVVRDYDEAIRFFVETLDFVLIEDTFVEAQNKRWVLVAPPGATQSRLLLARAVGAEQESRIGNQTGGRVFLFLHTRRLLARLPALPGTRRGLRPRTARGELRYSGSVPRPLWEQVGSAAASMRVRRFGDVT